LLIQEIGKKFGYEKPDIDGVFATGWQEAHITGVLAALTQKYPAYIEDGVRALRKAPVVYCSEASRHATIKAAKVCGLGRSSVKYIKVDASQKMISSELEKQIELDVAKGLEPFFVFATMGTTGAGAIEPNK